jgi:hypothetical protein
VSGSAISYWNTGDGGDQGKYAKSLRESGGGASLPSGGNAGTARRRVTKVILGFLLAETTVACS